MSEPSRSLVTLFERIASRLKSSQLVWLVGGLFVLDLFIPDPIPFVDEILLGLATLLIARWQSERAAPDPPDASKPPPKNVTPKAE